jgi:CRP-like cAMP-binding protein
MDPEMEQLYTTGLFQKRGFNRVDFCRLFSLGNQRTLRGGDVITRRDGKRNTTLYFLTKGNVAISSGNQMIATVPPNNFIGEMTFLNFLLDEDEDDENNNDGDNGIDNYTSSGVATADAIVDTSTGLATVWEWDFVELRTYLRGQREVSNALSAFINHDLRAKLMKMANTNDTAHNKGVPPHPAAAAKSNDGGKKEDEKHGVLLVKQSNDDQGTPPSVLKSNNPSSSAAKQ